MESHLANRPKALVYGWMGSSNQNLGDLFFQDIYRSLFPDFDFTFTDLLSSELIETHDAIFFGGGSFLDGPLTLDVADLSNTQIDRLNDLPIFFLGVGAETNIHSSFLPWLEAANLIVLRSEAKLEHIKSLNPKVMVAPDLVYYAALNQSIQLNSPIPKSILVVPNAYCLPSYSDAYWKHIHWEAFKLEFAQVLDDLIEQDYQLKFFPMCLNTNLSDDWAATEIVAKMKHRSTSYLMKERTKNLNDTLKLFSQYSTIITQRYHGKILADIAKVPSLTIAHHDKLKLPGSLSYYGINKDQIKSALYSLSTPVLPSNLHLFAGIKKQIEEIMLVENGSMGRSFDKG